MRKTPLLLFFSLLLTSCLETSAGSVEFNKVDWTYVTKEAGRTDATYGNLNNLFRLPKETILYHDTTYYLAINISVISSVNGEENSPRFITKIKFENFDVTNPIMEVQTGGVYNSLDDIETNETGLRSKESEAIFSLPPGKDNSLNYYIVFEIQANVENPEEYPIRSSVNLTFHNFDDGNFFNNIFSKKLKFLGQYQDGQPFSINIDYRQ
jgi:hypothetical protein